MKKRIFFCVFLFTAYLSIIIPFTEYLKNRPIAVKLGYVPDAEVIKPVAGEYRSLIAEMYVLKVLIYYGSLVEQFHNKMKIPPEYYNMYKTLEAAVILDPYNLDAYYFAQAAFTWELGRITEVNAMLRHGIKYRTWDYWLPFYAGFNSAYFLHDYSTGAMYMKRAAELSGNSLFATLAARFFYDAGENDLGIMFLDAMVKSTKEKKLKHVYELRKQALIATKILETAVASYEKKYLKYPPELSELVTSGMIAYIPPDPYGGSFYLDHDGKIRSSSNFFKEGKRK